MNKPLKTGLLFLGITAALTAGFFGIKYFVNRPKKGSDENSDPGTDTGSTGSGSNFKESGSSDPAPSPAPAPSPSAPAPTAPAPDYTVKKALEIKPGMELAANEPTTFYRMKDGKKELVKIMKIGQWLGTVKSNSGGQIVVNNYSRLGVPDTEFIVGPRNTYRVKTPKTYSADGNNNSEYGNACGCGH